MTPDAGTGKLTLTAEEIAAISRAVAEPRRFAMLQQIAATAVLPCAGLHCHASLSPATVSHHLKELQEAKLVRVEREGRGVRLSLRREVWQLYLQHLAQI